MGFFDKMKSSIVSTSKKVGSFMKNAFKESEEEAKERKAKEAEEKSKADAQNAKQEAENKKAKELADAQKLEAEKKAKEEQALREERVKEQLLKEQKEKENHQKKLDSMSVSISNEKDVCGVDLLKKIGAMDNDDIYIGGISSLKDESSMTKMLKKDKDKTYLSFNDGYFYVSRYMASEKAFKAFKSFKREDVGSVEVNTKFMEKKLEIKDKQKFYLIRIDVTDNGGSLDAIKKLLQ